MNDGYYRISNGDKRSITHVQRNITAEGNYVSALVKAGWNFEEVQVFTRQELEKIIADAHKAGQQSVLEKIT